MSFRYVAARRLICSRLHDRGLVGLNIAYIVSGLGWNVGIRVLLERSLIWKQYK